MVTAALLLLLLSLVGLLYRRLRAKHEVFASRGVGHLRPALLVGNSAGVLLGRRHTSEQIETLYKAFPNDDVVGHYELIAAQYVIRNPELVDRVLTRDFSHFHDRIKGKEKISAPADANLFILPGNTWRAVRNKFSPLFTSGKLRYMYSTIQSCGKNLTSLLDQKDGTEVDMADMMGLFAMDVIGSTAFGIEPTLLRNPDSKFREMGKKIFEPSVITNVKATVNFFFPDLGRLLGLSTSFVQEETQKYFCEIIAHTMRTRRESGMERNDFVQMLLQLKEKGKVEVPIHEKGDEYLMINNKETFEVEMTDNILVGGSFTFLLAGFHATAMTLAYALYELARRPEVKERLREEVRRTVKGEEPTYEELKAMDYLERVVKETARLHPTARTLARVCTKEYTLPKGIQLKPGDQLVIPVVALHKDPQYWEEPETFEPDRWEREPQPGTYLPFGDGPRVCIALRFAMLEMKYALVKLVSGYDFQLSPKTCVLPPIEPRVFLDTPRGGLHFRVVKLKA